VGLLQPDGQPETVTVSATDGMAVYWLKPLMETFRANHPSVGFVILGSDEDDTLRNYSGVDIARLCGNERIEVGEELHFLCPEAAHPVCSPDYLDTGIHPSRPWLKQGQHIAARNDLSETEGPVWGHRHLVLSTADQTGQTVRISGTPTTTTRTESGAPSRA
ncbi:MAG: LysR substrate-binding domain-containing protein, partial [Pseudomonadota bacterium]